MFYVGQRVVCVDDDAEEADGQKQLFIGREYRVAAIGLRSEVSARGNFLARFDGCPQHIHLEGVIRLYRVPYAAWRFRPVADRPTSIEIFTRMLNPSDEQVNA